MTKELIVTELCNRGYKVKHNNVVKNGVELEGISILTDSNVAPVIYTEPIIKMAESENKSLDDVVSTIIDIYENHKSFEFDVNMLFDRDFILDNIYIGLQKVSTEDIEKKSSEFEGIESYLYVKGKSEQEESYSIKITKTILNRANVSEVEVWEQAQTNTEKETRLESLSKIVCEKMNIEYTEDMDEDVPFFVITNKSSVKGASAILNKRVLAEFGEKYHTDKIVAIPSSVHEMIITPYTEETDLYQLNQMLITVNYTEVDEIDRLTDKIYVINV